MAATASLYDRCDGIVIDGVRWYTNTPGGGTVTESGGKIIITPTSNDPSYELVGPNLSYDLTGSYVFVQIKQAANGNCPTMLCIPQSDYNDALVFYITATNLITASWGGGERTSIARPSMPIWLGMREKNGITYWDSSPDGITWVNRDSVANFTTITSVRPQMSVENYGAEAAPGAAWFANFNVKPRLFGISSNLRPRIFGPGLAR